MGKRVLERVLKIRKKPRLVQELRRLEVTEPRRNVSSGTSAMACSSVYGTSLPITAAACRSRLSSGNSRSMRAARSAWAVAGCATCPVSSRLYTRPVLLTSTWVSTSVRALSSRKNGFPSVRAIKSRLSGSRDGSSPSNCIEQFFATLGSQRIDPQLDIVGLPAPGVLVLGPVVDEEQDAVRRQALHQTIQKCLGLGIDPVQILEEE